MRSVNRVYPVSIPEIAELVELIETGVLSHQEASTTFDVSLVDINDWHENRKVYVCRRQLPKLRDALDRFKKKRPRPTEFFMKYVVSRINEMSVDERAELMKFISAGQTKWEPTTDFS